MASSTTQTPFSNPFASSANNSSSHTQDLPIHASSNTSSEHKTYTSEHKTYTSISSGTHENHVSIPDGRRNSQGDVLHSPTENWKPNFKRVQSFNREDLKREVYKDEMVEEEPAKGTGFTEGGEGTRQV
ncbi:hypothetical protein VTL71DRAFT_7257 [Oculimacula yallundae]|uniref:Uncharacterized protein n=1 Tax=Oculimacula yallundae TaxID=86028 RepID=A0ABR4BXV1_9HELO